MESNCAICDKKIDVQMCCSGRDCGCIGMPVDPPVCSEKCYDTYMEYRKKVKTTPVKFSNIVDTKK